MCDPGEATVLHARWAKKTGAAVAAPVLSRMTFLDYSAAVASVAASAAELAASAAEPAASAAEAAASPVASTAEPAASIAESAASPAASTACEALSIAMSAASVACSAASVACWAGLPPQPAIISSATGRPSHALRIVVLIKSPPVSTTFNGQIQAKNFSA